MLGLLSVTNHKLLVLLLQEVSDIKSLFESFDCTLRCVLNVTACILANAVLGPSEALLWLGLWQSPFRDPCESELVVKGSQR